MPGKDIPHIQWKTFHDANSAVHVAPAIEGYLMKGHELSLQCRCGPSVNHYPTKVIIVHEIYH
jgi:hypothetical protein